MSSLVQAEKDQAPVPLLDSVGLTEWVNVFVMGHATVWEVYFEDDLVSLCLFHRVNHYLSVTCFCTVKIETHGHRNVRYCYISGLIFYLLFCDRSNCLSKQFVSLWVAFSPLFYLSADESPHLLESKYVGGWILITPYGKGQVNQVKNPKNKC